MVSNSLSEPISIFLLAKLYNHTILHLLGNNITMKKKVSFTALLLSIILSITLLILQINKGGFDYETLNKSLAVEFVTNNVIEECRVKLNQDINDNCFDNIINGYEKSKPGLILPTITYLAKDNKLSLKCHELTHRAGVIISNSVKVKDILLLDFNYCNYGLQHGALDVIAEKEKLDSAYIQLLCNSLPKNINLMNNCNHTLGHIIVEYTENDPNSALKLCGKDKTGACIHGVMMSFLQGYGDPKKYEKYFYNKNEISSFLMSLCENSPEGERDKCVILFPAFAYKYFPNDPEMINYLCGNLSEYEKRACYRGVASGVAILGGQDPSVEKTNILKKCRKLETYIDQCLIGYALFLLVNTAPGTDIEACSDLYGVELKYCNIGLEMRNGGKIDEKYNIKKPNYK